MNVALIFLLALIFRTLIIQAFSIPTGSMQPTLVAGDHILVSKFSYNVKIPFMDYILFNTYDVERGDIVVFPFPENKNIKFIKRIVGLPGEKIEIKSNLIFINDKIINDNYGYFVITNNIWKSHNNINFGPFIIPDSNYFVMGDNRNDSYDSRFWFNNNGGCINYKDIVGKAILIHWSWYYNFIRYNRTCCFIL